MFADFSILNSAIGIQNQTIKDRCSLSGTRQSPTLVNNLTKIGYPSLVAVATARKNAGATLEAGPLVAGSTT